MPFPLSPWRAHLFTAGRERVDIILHAITLLHHRRSIDVRHCAQESIKIQSGSHLANAHSAKFALSEGKFGDGATLLNANRIVSPLPASRLPMRARCASMRYELSVTEGLICCRNLQLFSEAQERQREAYLMTINLYIQDTMIQ